MAGPLVKDRVRQTTTTEGAGTLSLGGPVVGYATFEAVGDGNSCYFAIVHEDADEWEVALGTYTSAGTTLTRSSTLASSNAGSPVSFSAGTKDVFVVAPAERLAHVTDPQAANGVLAGPASGADALPSFRALVAADLPAGALNYAAPSGMRLTPSTGVPVPTTNVTGAGTIFLTPYVADHLLVPNAGATDFEPHAPGELSLSVSIGSGENKDVFVWNDGGNLTMAFSSAWTNATTRADALGTLKGVAVNNAAIGSMGAKRGIWVGTVRGSGSNTVDLSDARCFVWNAYHRARRHLKAVDTTDSWNYTTATFRAANNSTTVGVTRVEMVLGALAEAVRADVHGIAAQSGLAAVAVGVGVDSTSTNSAPIQGQGASSGLAFSSRATYLGWPGIGYHFLQWLEISDASGTTTWFGDSSRTGYFQAGIVAEVWA